MEVIRCVKNHQIPPEINHKPQLPPQVGATLLPPPHLQGTTTINGITLAVGGTTQIETPLLLRGDLVVAPQLQNSAPVARWQQTSKLRTPSFVSTNLAILVSLDCVILATHVL